MSNELGKFLRVRRSQLEPIEAGLPAYGVRRVPGLRREEVAVLAGVSADYYGRLEQGRERNPSVQVVGAIARALRLSDDARLHVYRLAGLLPEPTRRTADEVDPALRRLMDAVPAVVAYVVNRRLDVLAANQLADALLAPLADRRHLVHSLFHDPAARILFADWPTVARDTVEALRLAGGADPSVPALVGELLATSKEFAELWGRQGVSRLAGKTKTFRHPRAGRITVTYQTFAVHAAPGQSLLVGTAAPGTEDAAALARLVPGVRA